MHELLRNAALNGLRVTVTDMGGDFDAIVAEAGLDPARLGNLEDPLAHRKMLELVSIAARRTRRRDFGLAWGMRTSPSLLGPLAVAMLSAPSARSAIAAFARFLPQQNDVLRATLTPLDRSGLELFSLTNNMPKPPSLVHTQERNLVILTTALRGLLGQEYIPAEIWVAHAQMSNDAAYLRAFGRLPKFQQPVSGLVLRRSELDRPFAGYQPEVFKMAEAYLGQSMQETPAVDDPLARAELVLASDRSLSLANVARVMGIHERALQRRLQAAGITFSALKDSARRREAERLLTETRRPLVEITLELGFKDQAAFTRASRRWFGAPPTIVRKRLTTSPGKTGRSLRTDPTGVARRLRARPEGV